MKFFILGKKMIAGIGACGLLFVGAGCLTANNTTKPVGDDQSMDSMYAVNDSLVKVTAPLANQLVENPLVVTGEARGTWYFEASFPVKLYDANGTLLVVEPAQAQGEWMTEDFVPFSVTLHYATPTTATGTLVLEKDNPSGLSEHDDSRTIPVRFTQ